MGCDPDKIETWLRDEVKNHRANIFSLIQWGMTILAALASSLYFIRRDIAQAIAKNQFVIPAEAFGFGRWIVGSILLMIVAILFSLLYWNLLSRYYDYRDQLNNIASVHSHIKDGRVKRSFRGLPLIFFWAFPILDIITWFSFHGK